MMHETPNGGLRYTIGADATPARLAAGKLLQGRTTSERPALDQADLAGLLTWPDVLSDVSICLAFSQRRATGSMLVYCPVVVDQTTASAETAPLPAISPGPDTACAASDGARDLDRLRAAAEETDIRAFARAYHSAAHDLWSAETAAQTVRLALRVGSFDIAAELSAAAAKRYPQSAELARFAAVLGPSRWVRAESASDPSVTADTRWFAQQSAQYRGQWVAVRNGELLGAAATVKELQARVPDWASATVTRINW
jgi:hypothetical protein